MESSLQTISKIFTERLFRIPDYQRGYAWTEKQLKDFWNDLEQLDLGKNHYVGVLTLENVGDESVKKWDDDQWIIASKNFEPLYIVDGQQRLTTTIILIQAIIEHIGDDNDLNYTTIADIKRKFVFESKDKGISRSYIFGYEKDNPSYEYLKTKIFNENSEEGYLCQETIYTYNLEYAKKYFLEKLALYDFSQIELLYKKITQHFLFNIYTISDDIDVFVTFETMNNRGKPLSLLELLKNRLIYLTTRFNEDQDEKNRLRKKINECWKTVYHNLGKNKNNPLDDDMFLYNHLMFYFGKELITNDEKKNIRTLHRKFRYHRWDFSDYLLDNKFSARRVLRIKKLGTKDLLTIDEVNQYVDSLQSYVELWFKLHNPTKSDLTNEEIQWLDKINKLGFEDFSPLVLVFFKKVNDTSNRMRFLKAIEKILFLLTMVYKYTINYIPDKYYILAIDLFNNSINHDRILSELESYVKELYESADIQDRIKKEFRRDGFYSWDGIRYFLFEYEEHLRIKSKSSRIKIDWDIFSKEKDDFITVEHIFPQNSQRDGWSTNFSTFTSRQRSILKNSLGNLLPLSQPKNSSLQNKSFLDKIGNEDTLIGYRYGSYSENEITVYEEWTAENILDRGHKLLNFMETNWGFNFGTLENKKEILGLDFLVKI
jgi:uncharacterized protein with ParB-like and HNH nuclease domain